MQWFSLHDHGASGHNRCGIFSWKEMWSIQRALSPVSVFPPHPRVFITGEWNTASISIQIKLVIIVLISVGLVARSNYNKWELKRFTTGHFNSQMACLRMSYMRKAPVRLQRKVCLSSSSSACRQKWWSLANISVLWRSVTWHTSAMSIKNIIIKLIEEITGSYLRRYK